MVLIVSLGILVVSFLDLTILWMLFFPATYQCYVQMLSTKVSLFTSSTEERLVDLNRRHNAGQKCLGHSLEFKKRRTKFCFLLKGTILLCFPTSFPPLLLPPNNVEMWEDTWTNGLNIVSGGRGQKMGRETTKKIRICPKTFVHHCSY